VGVTVKVDNSHTVIGTKSPDERFSGVDTEIVWVCVEVRPGAVDRNADFSGDSALTHVEGEG
jgi:hypothetical protein